MPRDRFSLLLAHEAGTSTNIGLPLQLYEVVVTSKPGSTLQFHTVDGGLHDMDVPENVELGQKLQVIIIPADAKTGDTLDVSTRDGSMKLVVAKGVVPGDVLVVEVTEQEEERTPSHWGKLRAMRKFGMLENERWFFDIPAEEMHARFRNNCERGCGVVVLVFLFTGFILLWLHDMSDSQEEAAAGQEGFF